MENEDKQKHDVNDASTSANCDTNINTSAQNEVQNTYVIKMSVINL